MPPKIKPHKLFEVWSPDDVAECLPGVDPHFLYRRLWDLVPLYPDEPRTPDAFSDYCLANWWDKLSREDQERLNQLAEAFEHR